MIEGLTWQDATAADLADIRLLRCSDGPLRSVEGELARPLHELEVEVGLQEDLSFPLGRDDGVLIARDAEGVAAVSWWWHKRSDAKETKLLVMAVSARWRGRSLGDELWRRTLDAIVDQAMSHGVRVATIWASVRAENGPCRKFLSRNRFWEDADEEALTDWYLRIDLPDVGN